MHKHNKHFSIPGIVAFSAVMLLLLLEANILVYMAFAALVAGLASWIYTTVAVMLGVLSVGFIAMIFIEHRSASILTRVIYLITASWTGAFAYICMAGVLYDTLAAFWNVPRGVGLGLFTIAFGVGVYGLVHAQHIVVRRETVLLPNLPEAWKGKTALWMSDLHLGTVRGPRFARKVTRLVNSLTPSIIFVGGDLYDGTHAPDPFVIAKPLSGLKAEHGVLYITGNHEEFDDPSQFLKAVQSLGMRILRDECIDIDGLQIVGVDYMHAVDKNHFAQLLADCALDTKRPSILLKHEPRDLAVAEQAGISLQLSGHTHRGQQWPFNYLVDIVYKGYGYGYKKYGSMEVDVSSGVGGWGPPVRVGSDCEVVLMTFV